MSCVLPYSTVKERAFALDHTDGVTLGETRRKHVDMGHGILIMRRFQGMARRADDGHGEEETEIMHIVVRGP